MKTQQNRRFLS